MPIRLHGEQSDPRCNFYLELAADKENPGAKRRGGGEGNSLFPGRWTLSGALRIIFTCGHRCFVDGRIHALIKLMQPNLCVCPPTELCLHTACLGAACPCHAHSCLRVVRGDGRGKGGRVTFMERYTLSKLSCGNACRTGRVLEPSSYEHVSPGLARGKMVNLGNRFLDTSPSSRKTQVFSTIIRLSSGRFFYDDVRNSLLDRRQKFLTSRPSEILSKLIEVRKFSQTILSFS